jgi:ACS family tartrate transporter-like MFS transporter
MNPPAAAAVPPPTDKDGPGRRVLARDAWRLLPFLCLLYTLNIIDRANVGFARLTMERDLRMSPAVYDLGIGLFYLGYLLFEVPSNLLLHRVGARRWIGRIMISWGVVSSLTMLTTGTASFYAVRVLLGVAEAGFFPGIVLYLTYWFPARDRARAMAYFMTANAFASIVSLPVSGAIMQYLDGAAGLAGWQWLFLLEGVPSVLIGFVVLAWLPDRPADATWLTADERGWLTDYLAREEQDRRERHRADKLRALLDGRVWLLIAIYFTVAVGANAAGAYYPTLVKDSYADATTLEVGLLSALPHVCAVIAMTLWSAHSDKTGERRGHVAVAALVAAGGWALAAWGDAPGLTLAGLCLAQAGMMSMLPTFWTLPTAFLTGAAAAGGIALINSVANLGGLLGPTILGQFGLWAMAGTLAAGAVLALAVRPEKGDKP